MSLKNVNTGDGLHFKGMVTLDIERGEEKQCSSYTNTITPAGKQFLASQACSSLFGCSPISYGSYCSTYSLFGTDTLSANSGNRVYSVGSMYTSMGVVLLNLDSSTLAGLGTQTNYLPVFDSTLENLGSQVVGYASVNTTPVVNGLEGSVDYQKPSYIANSNAQCGRWVFPEGVGTGTVNCIALMPMSSLNPLLGTTFRNWKYLDRVNPRYTNFTSYSTSYLIPGVTGYTTDEEILLNFSQDGVSKHKYNFVTGVMTDYPDSDSTPFWVPPVVTLSNTNYYPFAQHLYNGYLYVIYKSSVSATTKRLLVFDVSNSMSRVSNITFNSSLSSVDLFLEYGGSLYISCLHMGIGTSTNDCLFKINMNSSGYGTSVTSYNNYSTLNFGYSPSSLDANDYCFASYGGNYLLIMRSSSRAIENYSTNELSLGCVAYVFTDPTDVVGSIIGCLGSLPHTYTTSTSRFSLFSTSAGSGILQSGVNFGDDTSNATYFAVNPSSSNHLGCFCYDTSLPGKGLDGTVGLINFSPSSFSSPSSVSLSLDSWGANVLSYVVLPEPITIGANDVLRVSYGYAIQ